jgi:hypothetical protein
VEQTRDQRTGETERRRASYREALDVHVIGPPPWPKWVLDLVFALRRETPGEDEVEAALGDAMSHGQILERGTVRAMLLAAAARARGRR